MTRSRGEVKAFGQEIREIFAASVAHGPTGHRNALDLRPRLGSLDLRVADGVWSDRTQ